LCFEGEPENVVKTLAVADLIQIRQGILVWKPGGDEVSN